MPRKPPIGHETVANWALFSLRYNSFHISDDIARCENPEPSYIARLVEIFDFRQRWAIQVFRIPL